MSTSKRTSRAGAGTGARAESILVTNLSDMWTDYQDPSFYSLDLIKPGLCDEIINKIFSKISKAKTVEDLLDLTPYQKASPKKSLSVVESWLSYLTLVSGPAIGEVAKKVVPFYNELKAKSIFLKEKSTKLSKKRCKRSSG